MTQEERNKISIDHIMNAAIHEFGKYGYKNSSLNRVCRFGNISKGRLYHYFSDKDTLFYACAYKVFDEFTHYMNFFQPDPLATIEQNFHNYFSRRQQFFMQNPYYPFILVACQKFSNPPPDPENKSDDYFRQYNISSNRIIMNIFQLYSEQLCSDIDLATEVIRIASNRIQFDYGYPFWDPENPSAELIASNLKRFDALIHQLMYGVLKRNS